MLLPPAVVPPLTSLIAPVLTETVELPDATGVPLIAHEMLASGATDAGGVGAQMPTVTPAGKPEMTQDALVALAVAVALLVQRTVPA